MIVNGRKMFTFLYLLHMLFVNILCLVKKVMIPTLDQICQKCRTLTNKIAKTFIVNVSMLKCNTYVTNVCFLQFYYISFVQYVLCFSYFYISVCNIHMYLFIVYLLLSIVSFFTVRYIMPTCACHIV